MRESRTVPVRAHPARYAAAAAAAALIVGTAAASIAAGRIGISLRAWAIIRVAGWLAPDLDGEPALRRAIAKDRARGPAKPPRRLLKRLGFADEGAGARRRFRAWLRGARASKLRLLYLHGGGYVLDLQAVQWTLIDQLLRRLGGEVVAPIYPLAPEQGWEDGLSAARRAYLELAGEAGAGNVAVIGDSAGGGLALALAQALRDAGDPPPACLVLISPWLDIGASGEDQPALERRDPALTIGFLRSAGRLWAKDLPAEDPRVSPLFGQQDRLPPTIVFSGTRDVLDSDARRLAAANTAVVWRHYPEMMHVWLAAPIPEARRALDEAAGFIRHHARPGRLPPEA